MTRQTRFRLEAAIVALVSPLARWTPRRILLATGAQLGALVGRSDSRHLAIAADNLRRAFPAWDEERVWRVALDVYRHFGRVMFDVVWLQRRSKAEVLRIAEFVGEEHVRAALARGKGFVAPNAHLGNWEVHALGHGWLFGAAAVVGRPLDNPWLDRRITALRTQGGNTLISKHHALSGIMRSLRQGQGVAILMDQNVQAEDGIFVDFFGRPAATTTVVPALAAKTGAAILPSHSVLLPDCRYRVSYEAPLWMDGSQPRAAAIAEMTQRLTQRIETWIRETPEQWLWLHRRWKTQPPAGPASAVRE